MARYIATDAGLIPTFLGKRCAADNPEPFPRVETCHKQQRQQQDAMTKNGAPPASNSTNLTTQRTIIKLLSGPISKKDDASTQSLRQTQEKGMKLRIKALDKSAVLSSEMELPQNNFDKCEGSPLGAGLNQGSAQAQVCVEEDMKMLTSRKCSDVCEDEVRGEEEKNFSLPDITNCRDQTIVSRLQDIDVDMQTTTVEIQQAGFCKEHHYLVSNAEEGPFLIRRSKELSTSLETILHTETTHEEFFKKDSSSNEIRSLHPEMHLTGDNCVHTEVHVCVSKAGQLRVANASTIAEKEHEQTGGNPLFASIDDELKRGKGVDVLRRSSRIRTKITAEIKDTTTSTGGSSIKEEVETKGISLEPASDINGSDSKLVQSDFFLPVSKKCHRAGKTEVTNSPIPCSMKASKFAGPSSREKRAREEKLAESEDGTVVSLKPPSNNQEFFKPSSKKLKQSLMNAKAEVRSDSVAKEDKGARRSVFAFDLWTEAKLAAEENAQLCGGKPTHPFFSQHKAGIRPSTAPGTSGITNICSSHQAPSFEEVDFAPSPPFHVTQLLQTEAAIRDMQSSMYFKGLQSCKVDPSSFQRQCSHSISEGLDRVLRIPPAIGLSKIVRGDHRPGRPKVKNDLEPLLNFLKEYEIDSKAEPTTDENDIVISLAYLEDRLKSCLSERAKRWSEVQSEMSSCSTEERSCSGNLLWADVYQPQSPKQVCGNRESVKFLSAWLEGWQARSAMLAGAAGGELSHKKIASIETSDEDYDTFQEDSDHNGAAIQDDLPPNVLFLAGPVGSGKTAAVYACAKAHGYTVIEVNCSDNRNGSLIKQKFSESMESHRLGRWSNDFGGLDNAPSSHVEKSISSATDANLLDRNKKQKRKEKGNKHEDAPKWSSNCSDNKVLPNMDFGLVSLVEGQNEPKECDRAMTVLLFEDVDMVFEDDRGFMAAVAQVAVTAKRPIILTSNDERLGLPLSLDAELLNFKRPSCKELVVLAYLICVAEGVPCRPELLLEMARLCRHDIRLLLNYLQFWSYCKEKNSEDISMTGEEMAMQQPAIPEATALNLEAHHRLLPAFLPLKSHCNVTQLIASRLNETVFEAETEHDVEEGTKLEKIIAEAIALLKRSKKWHGKTGDSPSRREVEEMENVDSNPSPEDSDALETPVKNLKEVKAVARSPILREKIKKSLAMTLDHHNGADHKEEDATTNVASPEKKALMVESSQVKENGHAGLEGDYHKPVFESTSEPIYSLWSEFRDPHNKHSLQLSSASKQSYRTMRSLSLLSENFSACDVMSCLHMSNQTADTSSVSSCSESLEDSSLSRACSLFAHESLLYSVEECTSILDEHERRATISSEAMMLAINDPCALGKLVTNDGLYISGEWKLQNVGPSCGEQDLERLERKHALVCSLSARLPPKAQASLQGAAFHECVGFLARMGHLEQDRLASAGTRRRGRGFQTYFNTHPWNLSKESMDTLQQFGRFDR